MCRLSVNGLRIIVLWFVIITLLVNCVHVSSQLFPSRNDRTHNNRGHKNLQGNRNRHENRDSERHDRQNFPGQNILDRLKENLGPNFGNFGPGNNNFGNLGHGNNMNFGNLGRPFQNNVGQAIHNTLNILNKTFENFNQFSMGNFGNGHHGNSHRPNFPNNNNNNGVTTSVPIAPPRPTAGPNNGHGTNQGTTPPARVDDNVSHYIDGQFPVILLRDNEVRK